jgi:hypothetical protein
MEMASSPNNCSVPWQQSSPFHNPPLSVIPSEAEGSAVSLSLAAEGEEENCRSLGFARDDRKGRVVKGCY